MYKLASHQKAYMLKMEEMLSDRSAMAMRSNTRACRKSESG